ncbi:MAG: Glucan endo,3-beta-D-glucosidase [Candidatus Saccharibacteria bacterium]|nr:Glucan endo,3-beta-D-glucosidase [Candidatus Saccharibacteria bacterium]
MNFPFGSTTPKTPLAFEDSFEGSALDGSKWEAQKWPAGAVNNELQRYEPGLATVADNILTIEARKDDNGKWVSSRLHLLADHQRRYGWFEATIRCPQAAGAWPAFWLLGRESKGHDWPAVGEIDILEAINSEFVAHGAGHGPKEDGSHWGVDVYKKTLNVTQWHTYAVDVRDCNIDFYIDSKKVGNLQPTKIPEGGVWPFNDNEYYMILNLAVGGDYPGPPDASTPDRLTMQVKNVRIYE